MRLPKGLPNRISLNDIKAQRIPASNDIRSFFIRLASGLIRFGTAIRDVARWLYHAPSAFVQLLKYTVQRTISIALFTGKILVFGIAGSLTLLAACALLQLAFSAYKSRRKELHLRHLEQDCIRNRLFGGVLQEEREQARQRRLREEKQEQEAERRRAAEQALKQERARKAAEYVRVQREEQRKRYDEARRAQQKREDLRLYHRWRAACDKVFETSTGVLPEPPFWPCDQATCQLERHLKACSHSLERLFSATGDLQSLRDEKIRWHPNRPVFHKLQLESAEKMATEISQVIQSLLQ